MSLDRLHCGCLIIVLHFLTYLPLFRALRLRSYTPYHPPVFSIIYVPGSGRSAKAFRVCVHYRQNILVWELLGTMGTFFLHGNRVGLKLCQMSTLDQFVPCHKYIK